MRLRGLALSLLALTSVLVTAPAASPPVAAATAAEVVALVVEGVGNGHGRGLSQWGAYGRAVNGAQTWTQILDAYYGGTSLGTASTASRVRVRLLGHDGATSVGVISTTRRAMWAGAGYAAVQARQTATNRYDVYASSTVACPGASTAGWTRIATGVAGPITFATTVSETSGAAGDVLGLCTGGAVVHYRGSIQLTRDSAGATRVVNNVSAEAYLRGVISREVSTSWGNAGGGAGMNALRAQAVAARSYALSQNRYASSGGYATTCDSTACQAYVGSARRPSPTSATASGGTCESGNATFECANTNRAIAETAGRVRRWPNGTVVATEFSASNGPRTAGGTFPAVNDPWDDVPTNPNHRWTRIIDADQLEAAYGTGPMTAATTEPDPATAYDGVWDNRVRLTGTTSTVLVSALALRSAFRLPSHGFTVRAVTRGVVTSNSMRFIGDSVGLSISENSQSELPALLDGVFTSAAYDAVQNRCTTGCGLSGAGAVASVPLGTDVVVVELGYNAPTSSYATQIDELMTALRARQVERVVWINLAERSGRADFVAANQALAAAVSRWPELRLIDWRTFSAGASGNRNRWFASDGIHLTATGQAEMARYVRDRLVPLAEFPVGSSVFAWNRTTGAWAVQSMTSWQFRVRTSGRWSLGWDFAVSGDFDRDGRRDDLIVWDRTTGTWVSQTSVNYRPTDQRRGTFPVGYDDLYVGDFDSDGLVNDLFVWNHANGRWLVYSMAGFAPSLRASGSWSSSWDTLTAGDWDDDGRVDDVMIWDRQTNQWVVRSFGAGFASTNRSGGTWPPGYELAFSGDFNDDGRRDDLILVDNAVGTAIVYSWEGFAPTFRTPTNVGPGVDIGTTADLDDDGVVNDLVVFDRDARNWQAFTFGAFTPARGGAGTWPEAYDVVLEGDFG